jgi:putative tricarboxylic transport membrane protein
MDPLANLHLAFSVVLEPNNLLFCFVGVLLGTLVGVLPGLGPVATMSLLLPATFRIPPIPAIIMLAGIYYGAQYGGSITSILLNIPGEVSTIVTCLDGHAMAKQGRAGPALGISAFGSFIAGTLATVLIMLIAPPLTSVALKFGPPEYFSLLLLGITLLTYLAHGSTIKALMMACVGMFLGTIGTDTISGIERFTYRTYVLMDGLPLVPVAMGLFGIAEVLINIDESLKQDIYKSKISSILPTLKDWKDSILPILRGTFIGLFLGILPGGGAVMASFGVYGIEKKLSKHPEKFGKGAIEGVAGPESANNSASQGAFIPLLTLGIPANITVAILLGALMIAGIKPGPLLVSSHPDLFWGVIGSMYIGNGMLLILNLPLIPVWVRLLKIPYPILFPLILLFCLIGTYSISSNTVEVIIMIVFGIVGYMMRKFEYEGAPLILAFVLSPMIEDAFRQSLLMSQGSLSIFFNRPISLVFLVTSIFIFVSPVLLRKRPKATEIT